MRNETELLHASVIKRIWKKCKEEDMDIVAFAWRIQREAERAATPSAPTSVETDERAKRDKQHRDLFFAAYHLLDGVCEDHPALADVLNVDAHGALCHALAQLDVFYGINGPEDIAPPIKAEPGSRLEYELHVLDSKTCAQGVDPRELLEAALNRIEDMLAGDDGQAFKEARKFLNTARASKGTPL